MSVSKISKNVYTIQVPHFDAIISFGENSSDVGNTAMVTTNVLKDEHVPIGQNDDVLIRMHKLVCESPNKWRLIRTRRDFVIGKGLEIRESKFKDGEQVLEFIDDIDAETIGTYFRDNDLNELLSNAALQLSFAARAYLKITFDENLQPKLELVDTFHARPIRPDNLAQGIQAYKLNSNFGTRWYRRSDSLILPAFDFKNPFKHAVSIIDLKHHTPGQIFHPIAEWWGTESWTRVANSIPLFHEAGLKNGYNIKYHISFPDDYFDSYEGTEDEINKDDMMNQTIDKMAKSLEGVSNANKAIVTVHKFLSDSKVESGVKITALPNNMSDDAYTKLNACANDIQAQAHGVLPATAGINISGGGGSSGKELEVAANYQQAFLTFSDRELLLKIPYLLQKILGWNPKKRFVFKDVRVYTPDVTPKKTTQNEYQNANK
jgi:hypothetical protein